MSTRPSPQVGKAYSPSLIIYVVCLALTAAAWQILILDSPRNLFLSCLWSRWLRESVGNLLALVPTAGELAGARELTFHGVRPGMAGASSVVDLTLELLSQIAFTLIGLVLLFTWYQGQELSVWLAIGIGVSIFAAASFILAQRKGLFSLLERLSEKLDLKWAWNDLPGGEGIHQLYPSHLSSPSPHLCRLHAASRRLDCRRRPKPGSRFGIWATRCLGRMCLILESVAFALRTATFIVPSRLGVQEGYYVVLGAMFGLSPDVALALSLLKAGARNRDRRSMLDHLAGRRGAASGEAVSFPPSNLSPCLLSELTSPSAPPDFNTAPNSARRLASSLIVPLR